MSDFKNTIDFRKGKLAQSPYQDPTFLSFVILFDVHSIANSPLLAGAAERFYTEQLAVSLRTSKAATKVEAATGQDKKKEENNNNNSPRVKFYEERLLALSNFKTALLDLNKNTPWFFQGLQGIDRVMSTYTPDNPYAGGDDAKISISCLESINLRVSGLMHLYRKAVFDEEKWNWILPENLRKFSFTVYVTEVRKIKNMSNISLGGVPKKISLETIKGFPGNLKPSLGVTNSNDGISGSAARPFFMFKFGQCEFDLTSGSTPFGDLTKNPEEQARQQIDIKYEIIERLEARVLNGIVEDTFPNGFSPAPDSEDYKADGILDFLGDKLKDKLEGLKDRLESDINLLAKEKMQELKQAGRDAVRNNTPNFENIYRDALRATEDAVDNIGANIAENVFNVDTTATVGEALSNAAAQSLGNVND